MDGALRWPRAGRKLTALVLLACIACDESTYDHKTESQWLAEFQAGPVEGRIWAAGALGVMRAKSPKTRHALVAALGDASDGVAVAAAKAMVHLPEATTHRERVIGLLLRVTSQGRGPDRLSAIEALGLNPYQDARSVPVLIAALGDAQPGIRATAAMSLGMLGETARPASDALHAALRDTHELVRHEIQDALRSITGEQLLHAPAARP